MRQLLTHALLFAVALHVTACTLDEELASDESSLEEALDSDGLVTSAAAGDTTGPYRIKNYHSGKCLEVPGNSTANSVRLDQWTCVAGRKTNEDWYLDWVSSASFRIRNRHSGKCMNVQGNSTANGAHIIQYTCSSAQNEIFTRATGTGHSGFYWIGAVSSARYLNISGASTANGADLIQWDPVAASNMWFSFTTAP